MLKHRYRYIEVIERPTLYGATVVRKDCDLLSKTEIKQAVVQMVARFDPKSFSIQQANYQRAMPVLGSQ